MWLLQLKVSGLLVVAPCHPRGSAGDKSRPSHSMSRDGTSPVPSPRLQGRAHPLRSCREQSLLWDSSGEWCGARACRGGISTASCRDCAGGCMVPPVSALPLRCSPGFQGGKQGSGPSQSSHLQPQSSLVCGCMWVWDFFFFFNEAGTAPGRLASLVCTPQGSGHAHHICSSRSFSAFPQWETRLKGGLGAPLKPPKLGSWLAASSSIYFLQSHPKDRSLKNQVK